MKGIEMNDKHYSIQIDKEKALEEFAAEQKRHELLIELAEKIYPVLQKFDGKKITKRIKTAIEKELPDWCITLDQSWSTRSILLWKNWNKKGYSPDLDYQHGFTFYLEREEYTENLSLEKTISNYPFTFSKDQRDYDKSVEALAYDQASQEAFCAVVDLWNESALKLELIKNETRGSNTPYQYLFDWK